MLAKQMLPAALILCASFIVEAKTSEQMECRELPARVQTAAAKQKAKAGTQRSCEKIIDNGETFYELKVTAESGRMREIVYRPDGQIAEVEDEGQLSEIPSGARTAIEKLIPAGELRKVDIIQRGSTRLYEGEYQHNGEKKKLIVNADGRTISK